jgi:hypothetical protein
LVLIGLILVAVILIGVAAFIISIADELMSSTLMAMDRDPPESVAAWKLNRAWEILPSWALPISVWLSLFFFVFWRAWRRLAHILS